MSRGRLHLAQLLPLLLLTAADLASATTVTGLAAAHRNGQTFLTWTCPAGTGWTYRVYSSTSNIRTSSDLNSATLVGSVRDSTWYDRRLSVITGTTYAFCTDTAVAALGATKGLFVATPSANAQTSYAVTAQASGGSEDRTITTGQNALSSRISEQLNPPRPVYQRTLPLSGGAVNVDVYTLWTCDHVTSQFALMGNRPSMAFDCGVVRGAPSGGSLLIAMHSRGSNFLQAAYPTGHPGQWVIALDDPLQTRDLNSFYYGYDELYDPTLDTNPVQTSGTIRPYTLERVLYTVLWARSRFGIDTTQVYAYGFSMAAIGSVGLAIRRPGLIAGILAIAGKFDFSFVSDPNPGSAFNEGGLLRDATDRLWGSVLTNLMTSDHIPNFSRMNYGYMAASLAPASLPPIIAMNGKNDLSVGWAEKIPYYQTVEDTRQGGIYFWDMRDHYANATNAWSPMQDPEYLYRFRTNLSFPALSHCSTDGDPGNGLIASGDSVGTLNGFLEWDTTLVDQPQVWETTLRLRDLTSLWGPVPAPESLTVDVTPRRLQRFPISQTTVYAWRVTRLSDGAIVQTGNAQPDGFGRLTVPGVTVYRSGTLVHITGPSVSGVPAGGGRARALRLELPRNPLVGQSLVRVSWPEDRDARIDLLDLSGRRVRELFHARGTGAVAIPLEARDMPPGVYVLLARQGGASAARRVVILR